MSGKEKDIAFPRLAGVNYDSIMDRQVGDKRFEREKAYKESNTKPSAVSSTFDAFQRMAAGLEGRKIADKIADPNRPTWEQYKKDNEEKLDMVGSEVRKMVEYRAELDKERERRLKERKREIFVEESDQDEDSDAHSHKKAKKHKKEKKKHKRNKDKKHKDKDKKKKHANHSSRDSESTSSSSDSGSDN
jgi:hypothetical protein